jgi:hypothetical protein
MDVSIKNFGVALKVKTSGIELDVAEPNGKHIGDLYVTKKGLIWCSGKITRENGINKTWSEFIALMSGK